MERPKIQIPRRPTDELVKWISLIAIISIWILTITNYSGLPEVIPIHFGPDGSPDGYGSKNWIWLMPIIGTIIALGLGYLLGRPHTYNYPVKITAQNAERQYTLATRMIAYLRMLILTGFLYIQYGMIRTAVNKATGLGKYFAIIFLGFSLSITLYTLLASLRQNK